LRIAEIKQVGYSEVRKQTAKKSLAIEVFFMKWIFVDNRTASKDLYDKAYMRRALPERRRIFV